MNLTDFFYQEGKKEERETVFPLSEFRGREIKNVSGLNLTISNLGKGKAKIEGRAAAEIFFECDRCLKEVEETLELDFVREVFAPEEIMDEELKEEQQFMEGYELNVQKLVEEELQLSWPVKVLCSEECRGICKKCGQNLNEGECGCEDFVPDIRFAGLMDIFRAANETPDN